ncbi:MAG: hypothetical protein IT579_08615 [Verrucomicrobia subdivision 3 bacterium]|nr:hypothetical protein [Limisphaerales bacterium]
MFIQARGIDARLQRNWDKRDQRASVRTPDALKGAQQQGRCLCGVTNWFRVAAESSGFSALMPMQPTTSVVTNDTAAGPIVISIFTSEISPTVAFSILHNSYPTNIPMTDTEQCFAGAKQALGADGHLISEHVVSLSGYPGREWSFEKYRGQAVVTMRGYLVGHDFYQAITVMHRGQVCQQHIAEFLDSCQFKTD